MDGRVVASVVLDPLVDHVAQQTRAGLLQALAKVLPDSDAFQVVVRVEPCVRSVVASFAQDLNTRLLPELTRAVHLTQHLHDFPGAAQQIGLPSSSQGLALPQTSLGALSEALLLPDTSSSGLGESRFAFAFSAPSAAQTTAPFSSDSVAGSAFSAGGQGRLNLASGLSGLMNGAHGGAALHAAAAALSDSSALLGVPGPQGLGGFSPGASEKYYRQPMFAGAPGRGNQGGAVRQQTAWSSGAASPAGVGVPNAPGTPSPGHSQTGAVGGAGVGLSAMQQASLGAIAASLAGATPASTTSSASPVDSSTLSSLSGFPKPGDMGQLSALSPHLHLALQQQQHAQQQQQAFMANAGDVAARLMGSFQGYSDGAAVVTASPPVSLALSGLRLDTSSPTGQQQQADAAAALSAVMSAAASNGSSMRLSVNGSSQASSVRAASAGAVAADAGEGAGKQGAAVEGIEGGAQGQAGQHQQPHPAATIGVSPTSLSPGTSPASSVASSSSLLHQQQQKAGVVSMAAKLQQGAAAGMVMGVKPKPMAPGQLPHAAQAQFKPPADMPPRFRMLPPSVQCRIYTLTKDNHVVLLKDFDEKVVSKICSLVDKFGAQECLNMLDRIEEVLKGKAGRLANGPGYLDVSVSTRLDELKQRAAGQVTAPEDFARSTLHSRIYAELKSLVEAHSFLRWEHFDQGIINMLKKMPNNLALERLNELRYHSFKNVDNVKSCVVSILSTKPKYSSPPLGSTPSGHHAY